MRKSFLAVFAAFMVVVLPALASAQTATVTVEADVPPPPAQPAPQTVYVQPQPQPQPYVQPQYGQPQYAQPAPQPMPRQTATRSRPTWGLIIPGAIMFGVSWIVHAALISPFAGYDGFAGFQDSWSTFRTVGAIPLVGPWIQMAVKPTGLDDDSWAGYLAVDGILQAAGLTMLILGIVVQSEETYYVAGDADGPNLALMPTAGPNGGGLAALGHF